MPAAALGEHDELTPKERQVRDWRFEQLLRVCDGDEEYAHLLLAADPPVDLDAIRRAKQRGWKVRDLVAAFG